MALTRCCLISTLAAALPYPNIAFKTPLVLTLKRHSYLPLPFFSLATLLEWVGQVAAVEVVANSPGLAVALLEVPEVGRLQEAIVHAHAHQCYQEDTVEEEWSSLGLKHALEEAVDGP